MKKFFLVAALCALTIAGNAYNYLAAPTDMKVTQNGTTFTLSWSQKCKNTAEYSSKPNTTYTTTVKLVLIAEDSQLEGVYTNSGSKRIDMANSQLVYKTSSTTYKRVLIPDSAATFTITKVDDKYYSIGVGRMSFKNVDSGTSVYNYNYCYAEDEILKQGISPTPFVFGLNAEEVGDYYLCAITDMTIDTLKSTDKNQFTLNFTQKCKYAKEYQYPNKFYTRTVKLVLNSDDRTLDGVYSTAGASATSSSANTNDQTINLVTSEISYDGNNYVLRSDVVSTFTIIKIDENTYGISEGELYFTQRVNKTSTWLYKYCYAEEDLPNKDATPTPYEFGWKAGFEQAVYNYDMTVNGISVRHEDTGSGYLRYFLTLNCTGKNRETNVTHNYEVELAIMPMSEGIAGEYSTRDNTYILDAWYSYVKDLNKKKQRYICLDSISTIMIESTGTNQYSFYGGTLICVDLDLAYQETSGGKKRVAAVHYYHFSDEGVPFGWDETSTEIVLTGKSINIEPIDIGLRLTISAEDENHTTYSVLIELENGSLAGDYTYDSGLSWWSKVERGTNNSYIDNGTTVTINDKGNNQFTISGNLICEDSYTYILQAFDFINTTTGIEDVQGDKVQSTKVLLDGQMYIIRSQKIFDAQGKQVR